jgi:hypothetical protein
MPHLFSALEVCVRKRKLEPREVALQYGHPTPGYLYDIMGLLEEMMVKLRKVLKDLRRAELWPQQKGMTDDRIRAEARGGAGDGTSAQGPQTSDHHGRRESGADTLRHESNQALDNAEYDKHADEMCDEEAFVEELEAQANRNQQAGRETAERVREEALYAIKVYMAGDESEEVEAAKAVAIAVQARVDAKAAEAAFIATVAELPAQVTAPHGRNSTSCDWPSISRKIARGGSGRGGQSGEPPWKCRSEPRTRGMARQSRKRNCITTP